MFKRVVLGISGGVDSAVAGLILKKKGFDVVAVFMRNWDEKDEKGRCLADKEAEDAEWVCRKLDIPFRQVDFIKEYWTDVFSYLLEEYQNGLTPNPDIYCNKQIKFDKFLAYALDREGVDAIATGHYARTSYGDFLEYYNPDRGTQLLQAVDLTKDQTFFLSQVSQSALRRTMFPLGNMTKEVVRKIARTANLDRVSDKDDSTGICFIGKRRFADFISEYVMDKPGAFIDIETNKELGKHRGLHHWTLGQRSRLQGFSSKYFICDKDVKQNIIHVARGSNHPALFCYSIDVEPFHWINGVPDQYLNSSGQLECKFRFQHLHQLVDCTVAPIDKANQSNLLNGRCIINLSQPQRAITPGQFAVIYRGEECLGSAKILNPGPSLYRLNLSVPFNKEVDTKNHSYS